MEHRSTWWERAAIAPLIVLAVLGLALLAAPLSDAGTTPAPPVERDVAALSRASGS